LKHYFFAFILITYFAASCDVLEVADFTNYPVKIEPLELEELVALNETYKVENAGHICSTLNEYGYTGFSRVLFPNDENPCLSREIVRKEIFYSDYLITKSKSSLLKNKIYTNVMDTSALEVIDIVPLYGCIICEGPEENSVPLEYKISFGIQKIDKSEVRDTELTVFIDSVGVNRIWGNWYPDFQSPGLINVGYLEAQKIMIGWQIDMLLLTGEDIVFEVMEANLEETPIFEYIPFINDQILELRKTWKVPISYTDDSFDGWYANVDVIDGLLLSVVPINEEIDF